MGRSARVAFPGAKYHAMARGNWRADIFSRPADYTRFLMQLRDAAKSEEVIIFAYVLMTNHYHLFIETPHGNISRFMQRLNTAYGLYFRHRTQKPGHCFQGRYVAQLVQGDDYCIRLTRYIHLNPINTGKFENATPKTKLFSLRNYEWSSYSGYVDKSRASDWVDYRWLSLFDKPARQEGMPDGAGTVSGAGQPETVSGHRKLGRMPTFLVQTPGNKTNHPVVPDSPVLESSVPELEKSCSQHEFSRVWHRPNPEPEGSRQEYAKYIASLLDCKDDFINEDNETGKLLDTGPIGDDCSCENQDQSKEIKSHENLDSDKTKPMIILTFEQITQCVAKVFRLKESALFSHGLHATMAKSVAIELACRLTGLKQYEVAQRFGYASESSVGKQRKRLTELLSSTPDLAVRFAEAQSLCEKQCHSRQA